MPEGTEDFRWFSQAQLNFSGEFDIFSENLRWPQRWSDIGLGTGTDYQKFRSSLSGGA